MKLREKSAIQDITTSLSDKTVTVTYDTGVSKEELKMTLDEMGYKVLSIEEGSQMEGKALMEDKSCQPISLEELDGGMVHETTSEQIKIEVR